MIDLVFDTTNDYSALNPAKFVKINKTYNTVLLPKKNLIEPIQPTDIVTFSIDNKLIKQKAGIDCGTVNLYSDNYYYFYIVPGFDIDTYYNKSFDIFIGSERIKLKKYLDPSPSAKIINGLLVLPNNYNYVFNHTNYGIILANKKNLFSHLIKKEAKYSYYMPNTNNTLIHILDNKNINSLYEINNTLSDTYIRPLFNNNYPLGSAIISAKGVSNSRIKIGNSIYLFNGRITIDHLPYGKYNISLLDQDNQEVPIKYLNGILYEKNNFIINIDRISYDHDKISSLQVGTVFEKPMFNMSNLLINIHPNNKSFELIGPNNFYKKYTKGYQKLKNIESGNYTIKYDNITKDIFVIKNDNNYFSNKK